MKPGDVDESEANGEYDPYGDFELEPERTVEPLPLSSLSRDGFDDITRALAEWEKADVEHRDPRIWARDAAGGRPLSDAILEPIRAALRARKVLSVRYFRSEPPLTDETMEILFGDGLEALEKQLGRLLLHAVIMGDDSFQKRVNDALKDANALFHRTTANEAFHKWSEAQPRLRRDKMSLSEVRQEFEAHNRPLSSKEWAEIRSLFQLQRLPRKKAGRRRRS